MIRAALALLPAVAAFWAGACFVWNHFLTGPYLLDSGWFSALVYRAGVFPDNPPCTNSLREYFGLHLAPLLSLASLLSPAVPLGRVEYYCLFQGLIYAPLGGVTALLARPRGLDRTWGGAALVLGTSLLFAFNGQVLACLAYPHFEIFLAAGLCVLLAGVAAGRPGIAWLGLVMAVATREDGGFHVAAFALMALACSVTGRPFPIARRTLVALFSVGLLASVAALVSQRVFFEPGNLFEHLYTGSPPYAHVSLALVRARLELLPGKAAFMVWPFVATIALAIAARDARYLLGWLAELPWFVLNLLAVEELKSAFTIYTGFPFVASLFWVGAYGQVGRALLGRQRWLSALSLVSGLATGGMYWSYPEPFVHLVQQASVPADVPHAGIAEFGARLEQNPNAYGRVLVDRGVASWAVTSLPAERCVSSLSALPALNAFDGFAFFRGGSLGPDVVRFITQSPYSRCGRIRSTDVFMCVRPGKPLLRPFEPANLAR
ncbi:MAG TPA: hypothetical protein VMG12_00750 [Polyangiaceae bacterium]|nr:hypothetical protein [Polyangiaceae bacterium]